MFGDDADESTCRVYVPAGWPVGVLPPGAEDWEVSARAFLLDCCPGEYRGHSVVVNHPVVAAEMALVHVDVALASCVDGLGRVRRSLRDVVPPEAVQRTVEAWQAEQSRLRKLRREVELVAEALRGAVFVPRL